MNNEPAGFETFFQAYLDCALWSSYDTAADEGSTPENLDDYSVDDIDPASLAKLREYALDFFNAQRELFGLHYEQAGHDFWLTRNGHGAGFWDRGNLYGDNGEGDTLSDAAKVYGGVDLYSGDDRRIHATE